MEEDFVPEKIRLYSAGVLTYSDIAPFLDKLNQRHMFVNATVSNTEPAAAGLSEIALTLLVASTSIPYLKGFFGAWGEEDARQLRAELLRLLERGRRGKSGRKFVPLMIHFSRTDDLDRSSIESRVRFNFHQMLTEEEFLTQTWAAQQYMESLPDKAFERSGGPFKNSLFWYNESQSWRGVVKGFRDDGYFPPGILG